MRMCVAIGRYVSCTFRTLRYDETEQVHDSRSYTDTFRSESNEKSWEFCAAERPIGQYPSQRVTHRMRRSVLCSRNDFVSGAVVYTASQLAAN